MLIRHPTSSDIPPLPGGCSLSFPVTGYSYLAPTSAASGKRIYMFPGLNVNISTNFESGPLLDLNNALRAAGDEVVIVPLPAPQPCFFSNGGWQYREQFNAALNVIMTSVEAEHGMASKNIAAGISYGGLHSMMAMSSNGRFSSWFAHLPLTRFDVLPDFSSVGDVKRFNPFFEVDALKSTTGFISWATADYRVNWALTKTLSQSFGSGVTKVEYLGQDHSTNAQNVADMAAWAATQ